MTLTAAPPPAPPAPPDPPPPAAAAGRCFTLHFRHSAASFAQSSRLCAVAPEVFPEPVTALSSFDIGSARPSVMASSSATVSAASLAWLRVNHLASWYASDEKSIRVTGSGSTDSSMTTGNRRRYT